MIRSRSYSCFNYFGQLFNFSLVTPSSLLNCVSLVLNLLIVFSSCLFFSFSSFNSASVLYLSNFFLISNSLLFWFSFCLNSGSFLFIRLLSLLVALYNSVFYLRFSFASYLIVNSSSLSIQGISGSYESSLGCFSVK